jgi:hypothetical protein
VRITFSHYGTVDEVRAIFRRTVGLTHSTITLIGEADETVEVAREHGGRVHKQCTAVLVTLVDVDHRPGPYYFHMLTVRTASGSLVRVESSPKEKETQGVAFNIAEERHDLWDVTVELEELEDAE